MMPPGDFDPLPPPLLAPPPLPPLPNAVTPLPVYSPQPDPGPFLTIGQQFGVPGGDWRGHSIVSPNAFYLLKVGQLLHTERYGGGAIGTIAARLIESVDSLSSCDVLELPQTVRDAIDKGHSGKSRQVIVLPRQSIRLVEMGKVGGVLVHVYNDTFILATGLFNKGKIRTFLLEHGWAINQPLTPTAPVTYWLRPQR